MHGAHTRQVCIGHCDSSVPAPTHPTERTRCVVFCLTPNCLTNAQQNCLSHFSRNPLICIGLILRTADFARPQGTEKRERKKGPKPWKTGAVAKCQVHKKNPVSLSENGVCHMQRETLCRGFMVVECGPGFKLALRTG